ncbi:spore coat protein SA [Symbiobacterium terraclitae]|uniref:Spore coat protein SA n=1 Tax=Symbiobacterium terraclitae TaxID=557451 RepID=A0ABS4JQL7_9FIRM|nr:glycosyltransferase family 4 protein [Symbiobacterium terraclitae]MBP2017831.1 spore coat protein SA [Symbiobacterium terraclitae]
MRIALVCTEKLPVPPVRGGAIQTYIDGVLPFLSARHDVTVVGRTDPALPDREAVALAGPSLPQGRAGGGTVRHVRLPAEGGAESYGDRAAAFLATERWDVVEIFNRPAFVERIARAAPGARLVLSLHNAMFAPHRLSPAEARRILARVDAVVTISDFIRGSIARLYPEYAGKLRTIRSGVDLERFRPGPSPQSEALRARLGLAGRPVVLSVGRLSAKKGIHVLLEAMERVLLTHPEAVLVQVGSRWYGRDDADAYVQAVRQQAARLGDGVRMVGYVPYHEVDAYFRLGDLFVCASQWEEPLARVHYEAMACGLPIVTTDRGGNAEVVEEGRNGLLVRPCHRPEGFASAIQALLDDPDLRRRLGAEGRRMAEESFSWERVAREQLAVLEG